MGTLLYWGCPNCCHVTIFGAAAMPASRSSYLSPQSARGTRIAGAPAHVQSAVSYFSPSKRVGGTGGALSSVRMPVQSNRLPIAFSDSTSFQMKNPLARSPDATKL